MVSIPKLSAVHILICLFLFFVAGILGFFIGKHYHSHMNYPPVPSDWKTFSHTNPTISFSYPSSWQMQQVSMTDTASRNNTAYVLSGLEGSVGVAWGNIFPSVCPPPQENIILADGSLQEICHLVKADGKEVWSVNHGSLQLGIQANTPAAQTQQIILSILSSLRFN